MENKSHWVYDYLHEAYTKHHKVNNIIEPYNMCRQILPKTYLHNGYLDVIKTESFFKTNSISGDKILSYIMDKSEIDDLDTIEQWEEAEKKI